MPWPAHRRLLSEICVGGNVSVREWLHLQGITGMGDGRQDCMIACRVLYPLIDPILDGKTNILGIIMPTSNQGTDLRIQKAIAPCLHVLQSAEPEGNLLEEDIPAGLGLGGLGSSIMQNASLEAHQAQDTC